MNPNDDRVEAIFHAALEISELARRDALIEAECGDDLALEMRVRRLIALHEDASGLLGSAERSPEVEEQMARLKPEEAGERIGPYKLLQQIGEGGFGVVWMAEQEQPVRRRVALKIIKLGMDTKEVIGRFEQERQALAMMEHPNIAKVFDAGATQYGRPFFVMELVRGVKITDYCDEQQLPTEARLALFIRVCQAVQHAHQKGIIHRDLKPSNILVTINDGEPVPKVIDFGVAKATQERLTEATLFTQFEQMVGTPLYMSPEQAELTSLDIDTRSDIYSLGVLLYELLTGRTPIDTTTMAQAGMDEIRRIIREVDPPRPSTRLKTLDGHELTTAAQRRHTDAAKLPNALRGDLDWIVMKCLEKDRKRRYDTATGLALDLQRHLANEIVTARPPTTSYLLGKLIRRNKLAFAASAAVAASLVLGIATATVMYFRESTARKRATDAEGLAVSRLAEVAAERDAKEQARQDSEQISKFLTEVFESPDPGRDGRTIKVSDLLDTAAKKLETDLSAQPSQRANLRATLGSTYRALGLFSKAIALEEKVRDYRLAALGPQHLETLKAMHNLAISYEAVNRKDEALKLKEEVFRTRRKVLGPEDPETLGAMTNFAIALGRANRLVEAIALQEQALAIKRRVLAPEHPYRLIAQGRLAELYEKAGRNDEALKLREEVLVLSRKARGPEHPDTLWSLGQLANSYDAANRKDDALKVKEEVLALSRKVFGSEHPNTLWRIDQVAISYLEIGRTADALPLLVESSTGKPDDTILALELAALQVWLGRDADYAATRQRMLKWGADTDQAEIADRVAKIVSFSPADDPATREGALILARRAVELGKGDSALPWYRLDLGMAEYRSGHYPEAEQALLAATQEVASLDAEDRPRIEGIAGFYRAMSLSHQGRQDEARELFIATEATMKSQPADDQNPFANHASHDDLILWLADREVKALLASAPPK